MCPSERYTRANEVSLLHDVISPPQDLLSDAEYVARLAQELDDEFQRLGPDTVAAFVAEPIVGAVRSRRPDFGITLHMLTFFPFLQAMSCVPPVDGYFPAMKAVCDKYGALFIMDEIMSGMGRSGTLHAWQDLDVIPDLQTIGKGLGGGFVPIAGVLIGQKVIDALDKGTGAFVHGQTYQGHPVCCAAALEVQKIVEEEDLMANARFTGDLLEKGLRERLANHKNVGDIRGKGLFWGVSGEAPHPRVSCSA